jgi:chorismate synthase
LLRHIGLTTAGESHGRGLLAIVTGLPAGVPVAEEAINADLARRQVGFGRGGRMRIETDRATIVSGIRHGLSLGSPVGLQIDNRDWENWREEIAAGPAPAGFRSAREVNVPRPGHADLAGAARFGHTDMRNVLERASARETAARVAGGAVCKALLAALGVSVRGHVVEIGGVAGCADPFDTEQWACIEASDVRCADEAAAQAMREAITAAGADGDTLGGLVAVEAAGVPPGLGSCAGWEDRLDAKLAAALMSIPAIKSVGFGLGQDVVRKRGSAVHDPIAPGGGRWWALTRASNRAGGLEG